MAHPQSGIPKVPPLFWGCWLLYLYYIMMGYFNINLLNFETHHPTDDFISTLGSYFFSQILQPTRVIDHSAILIDKIFFNSLEHHLVSGNIAHDLTDHLPKLLIFNKFSYLPTKTKIFQLDYSHFNTSALVDEIRSYSPRFS